MVNRLPRWKCAWQPRAVMISLMIIFFSVLIGIGSRKFGTYLPEFISAYAGDTMWALAFFALFHLLFPDLRLTKILLLNLAFAFLIEISQLWHPVWLDAIRHTLPGGLLLGFGFLWTDLVCYIVGSLIGYVSLNYYK